MNGGNGADNELGGGGWAGLISYVLRVSVRYFLFSSEVAEVADRYFVAMSSCQKYLGRH